ncbi:hypothetical protein SDC9_125514 [bioreactor metagenome]|uniref:Uncharacterized protein n=1 Tax=bioreactor metagenome TaxID=1076179 RepID=A0A645CNH3_9ZZZZ
MQRGRCARRDDDATRRDVDAEASEVPLADLLAQRFQAEGVGVLGGAGTHGAVGGFLDQGGRGEVGFADVQEDHRVAGASDFAGQRLRGLGHFHHIKRFDAFGAV